MNSTEHWNAWLRDLTPAEDLTAEERRDCPHCHGTGYVADVYGEAEACDECGDAEEDDYPVSIQLRPGSEVMNWINRPSF